MQNVKFKISFTKIFEQLTSHRMKIQFFKFLKLYYLRHYYARFRTQNNFQFKYHRNFDPMGRFGRFWHQYENSNYIFSIFKNFRPFPFKWAIVEWSNSYFQIFWGGKFLVKIGQYTGDIVVFIVLYNTRFFPWLMKKFSEV